MDQATTNSAKGGAPAPPPPVPRTGDDGKPVYDQEFFLALARLGKDVWNRWRDRHPDIPVTFEGFDFQNAGQGLTFSGFHFGHNANFRLAIFGDMATFSEAAFGQHADFLGAIFGPGANFSGATLGGQADFSGAIFGHRAILTGATFGHDTKFSGAAFGDGTDFSGTTFGEGVRFNDATFGRSARFSRAVFQREANFIGVSFQGDVGFSRAIFKGLAIFTARSIEDWKRSRMTLINESALQSWPEARKAAFVALEFHDAGAGPETFPTVNFRDSRFFGGADMLGRKFKDWCDLTGARFYQPPSFDTGDRLDRLDLYGVKIGFVGQFDLAGPLSRGGVGLTTGDPPEESMRKLPEVKPSATTRAKWMVWITLLGLLSLLDFRTPGWTTQSGTANRIRRLRDLAETTKNHDLDRDLYIEERKAERGVLFALYCRDGWKSLLRPRLYRHCLWILVGAVYWLLADCGRSFVRPFISLMVSVPIFWLAYSAALISPSKDPTLGSVELVEQDFRRRTDAFDRAVWAYAISNAVPFVGALTLERDVKLTLLCGDRPIDARQAAQMNQPVCVPVPSRRFQLLSLTQSIFSALCIFFAGLALRSYFKLR